MDAYMATRCMTIHVLQTCSERRLQDIRDCTVTWLTSYIVSLETKDLRSRIVANLLLQPHHSSL